MRPDSARTRATALLGVLVGAMTLALALALAGPVLAASKTVSVDNFRFAPDPIRISVGDSIRWRNDDPVPHTASARDGSFDTGLFIGGRTTDPITFAKAGRYEYLCETHPEMWGLVIVAPASGGVPPTDTVSSRPDRSSIDPLGLAVALAAAVMGGWVAWRVTRRRDRRPAAARRV